MQNAVHVILSAVLVGGFVLADLVPQMRVPDREPPAVWFAASVYAFALAVDAAVGLGVKMNAESALFSLLEPLLRLWK